MDEFEHTGAQPGTVIDGRYKIIEPIAQGGMGAVYKAEHLGIQREVAIKVLHDELRGTDFNDERFKLEALATGRLEHPNCVSITDIGSLDDGSSYMVMELLRGRSLADMLEEEEIDHLSPSRALRIARHVLKGLGHAHRAGVIHRDLKPENIFLVEHEDDENFAKILDFGIAKVIDDAKGAEGAVALTEAGMAIGSPSYMSPEQALGEELDGRTDLYSLGIVLYELICGYSPFVHDDKLKLLRMRILKDPPSMRELSKLPIPDSVEALVRDALAREKVDRIQSAEEFIERIDAVLGEIDGIVATPPPAVSGTQQLPQAAVGTQPVPSSELPISPRKLAIGGVGIVMLILIIAGVKSSSDGSKGERAAVPVEADLAVSDELGVADELESLQKELAQHEATIREGKGASVHKELRDLQRKWPKVARVQYLFGLSLADKRYWKDAFSTLGKAIELDPSLRGDELLIKAAIRGLGSRSNQNQAMRFLRSKVGDAAVPYLQETVEGGGEKQRQLATKLLEDLGDGGRF